MRGIAICEELTDQWQYKIAVNKDAQGFIENKQPAIEAGILPQDKKLLR